jgi:hypothetical protein
LFRHALPGWSINSGVYETCADAECGPNRAATVKESLRDGFRTTTYPASREAEVRAVVEVLLMALIAMEEAGEGRP